MRGLRNALIIGTSALAVLMLPDVSIAQEASKNPAQASGEGIAEIIVTAQKRDENLQDVPISITALTADAIENARITNVADIGNLTPNVIIRPAAGGDNIPAINIRGVIAGNGLPGVENPIALYVDGVYIARWIGAIQDIADIERVEVLRGPQGTLFGRNSTGGAIHFITARPSGELSLRQELSLSNYDGLRARVRVNLPEWNGFRAKFSYLHAEQDGPVKNLGAGTQFDWSVFTRGLVSTVRAAPTLGSQNSDAINTTIDWDQGTGLSLQYRFDWAHSRYSSQATQVLGFSDGPGGDASQGIFDAQAANGGSSLVSLSRLGSVNNWVTGLWRQRVTGHALTIGYELSDEVSVKNITAFRKTFNGDSAHQLDGAGGLFLPDPATPFFLLPVGAEHNRHRQFSNETQLIVDTDRFDLTAGVYYYKERTSGLSGQVVVFSPVPDYVVGNPQTVDNVHRGESIAAFAQSTFQLSDNLDLMGGLRYTHDRKSAIERNFSDEEFVGKFNRVDYLAGINYRFAEDTMVYGKISTGFMAGGILIGTEFQPEKLTSYEIGTKGDYFDNRLRLNAALFYSDYKDIQFPICGTFGCQQLNAGDAQIYGGEAEATIVPLRGLTMTGSLGYQHFEYKRLDSRVGNIENYRPVNRPEWTAGLSAQYEFEPSDWGTISFGSDAQYQSKMYFSTTPIREDPALNDAFVSGPYWLLNARMTLAQIPLDGATGKISVWGRNLTNKKDLSSGIDLGTVVVGTFMRPRMYGIDFALDF